MFAKLTTKIAMRKAGIPTSALSLPDTKSFSNDGTNSNAPVITNPFANMSVPKSWQSWATPSPPPVQVAGAPVVGKQAPATAKLRLPPLDGRPAVVVFLRHAGCPCELGEFFELRISG
jgi:hypothetical protein